MAPGSESQHLSPAPFALRLYTIFGYQPRHLDPSGFPAEADGDILTLDNNGYLADAVGVFQHDIQLAGIRKHVMILYAFAFLFKCFTSSIGVRSGILSID